MTRWKSRVGAATLVVGVLAGATACSSGGSDGGSDADSGSAGGSTSGGSLDSDTPEAADESRLMDGSAVTSDAEAGSDVDGDINAPARVAVQTRAVISTGRVTLEAKDLVAVREELDRMLGKYGGFVADEHTYNDDEGRTESSVLTLRIPSQHFDDAMRGFDELGTVSDAKRKTDDVTTEVIDVDARIRTEQVSLQRLRGFLSEATNVNAMIRLESEIARREANLASLQAQQRYLDDQTTLSTIVLTMHEPDAAPPPEEKKDALEDAGFLTGLQSGWNALLDILLVVVTVLGAVLPFAVVVAVIGLPAYLWLRRHRPTAPPAPADAG